MKAIVAIAGLLLLPALALAGDNGSSAPDAVSEGSAVVHDGPIENWGTISRSFLTLTAWNLQGIDSSVTYNFQNNAGGQGITRTNAAGSPWIKLPVTLPSGALVSEIEFNYCDTGAGTLGAIWFRQVKNAAPVTTSLFSSVGTPGCVVQTVALTPAVTIDNNANSYNIEFPFTGVDGSIAVNSVRVGYRLQVSPAPATASFSDVPVGSPQHRFVEALVAAGITGGCGGGAYCPNDAVTRGQMAVFLSVALGMHFPN